MISAYQLLANNFQDIRKALIIEHLFDIFLALRQSLWPQFLGFFIIILQLKKSYFHAPNARSVGTLLS